jgi:hypothetical protein
MRWFVIVRAGALVGGVAAIVCAVLWSVGPYQDTMAYRHAYLCSGGVPTPASAAHGCVARETGTVTGRHSYVETTSDESGTSKHTHYQVTYRRASGATETREVVASVYNVATSGERADLDTWRGAVVWITVAGQGDGFDPPTEGVLTNTAVLAWTGLGLLLWFLLGNGTLRQLFGNFGLRPLAWIGFGYSTAVMVHYALTYVLSTSDYVVGALLWLFLLGLCGGAVFGGFGDFDDRHGKDSLLEVLLERWLDRRWQVERG